MRSSQCFCLNCKKALDQKEIGVQTEPFFHKLSLRMPSTSTNAVKKKFFFQEKIIKLKPCKGDIDEDCDIFDECDISSIKDSSFEFHSLCKNFSKDETLQLTNLIFSKDDFNENTKIKPLFCNTARQSPDIFKKQEEFRIFSQTPIIHGYTLSKNSIDNEELSESYEQMIENFVSPGEDMKECLKNLISIEKKSMRKRFNKPSRARRY